MKLMTHARALATSAVVGGAILAAAAGPAQAGVIPATPATLGGAFSGAQPGDVIELAAGDYGTFRGAIKPGLVTVRAQAGASATMRVEFNPAANIRLDGLGITNLEIQNSRSHDVTVANSTFTGPAVIRTGDMSNANILFDRNTHAGIDKCDGCYEGRITLPGKTSAPSGVTIQNSRFGPGGVSDGIQNGGRNVHILGNEFVALQGGSAGGVHLDAIQLYGSAQTVIRGNWLHDVATGIMAPDGTDHEVIEHNVIDTQGYPYAITLGSDAGSIVRHNTFPDRACWFNQRCGIVRVDAKSGNPASTGTAIKDNVMSQVALANGSTLAERSHNLLANANASGPSEIRGKPTYKGGASPTTWDGFALAAGSLGKGNASDGTDRGAAILGPLGTPIPGAGAPGAPGATPGAKPGAPGAGPGSSGGGGAAPTGLVAAYGFGEQRGRTVGDASGNGNRGRIRGARRTKLGHSGRALRFDGRGDFVSVRHAGSLKLRDGMTLEAWVRPGARSRGWGAVLVKQRGRATAYGLYGSDKGGRPVGIGGRSARGPARVKRLAWTHLAVTYDGSAIRLWVDGRLVRERRKSGALPSSAGPLRIGASRIRGRSFKGLIDDVRVYQRPLGGDELRADMRAGV